MRVEMLASRVVVQVPPGQARENRRVRRRAEARRGRALTTPTFDYNAAMAEIMEAAPYNEAGPDLDGMHAYFEANPAHSCEEEAVEVSDASETERGMVCGKCGRVL